MIGDDSRVVSALQWFIAVIFRVAVLFEDFAGPGTGKILRGRAVTDAQAFPAPGKLNLMLRVTGRRADGYHLLQTVIRFIDYGDTLTFRVREDGVVTRVNEVAGVPAGEDLAVRAARRLQQASGTRLGLPGFMMRRPWSVASEGSWV